MAAAVAQEAEVVWLTPKQVAAATGLTTSHLNQMRYLRKGMPFYKPSEQTVLYKQAEVNAYIEASRIDAVRA